MSEQELRELAGEYQIPLPLVIALAKSLGDRDRLVEVLEKIDCREVGF